MSQNLTKEQLVLLRLIKIALTGQGKEVGSKVKELTNEEWKNILEQAKCHAVLSLLYDLLEQEPSLPKELVNELVNISRQTVLQSHKLLYLTNYAVNKLEAEGITVLVLKGGGTAAYYPVPELRKSGDIDLLVAKQEELEKACSVLEKHGFFKTEEQTANHHIVFESKDGVELELHMMLAEPFDNLKMNQYLEKLKLEYNQHICRRDIIGSMLPIPEDAYHAYYLLLHMLQHFLRSGFGLKLLCDWVVFWNHNIDAAQKRLYKHMLVQSGLEGFSSMITGLCVEYLGLQKEKVQDLLMDTYDPEKLQDFMAEILVAEEFGKSDKDRMVVMRGDSPLDYAREFHHQMHLNYPKESRLPILWPVLWVKTLYVFLQNNRKIRNISAGDIIKKAGARSRRIRSLHLFEEK